MQTSAKSSGIFPDSSHAIRNADFVHELLAYDVIGDVQTAILRCELARDKLISYPIIQGDPRRRGELVHHLGSHLFFLRKTLANLEGATVHG